MNNLEKLLRNYSNNFLILDDVNQISKVKYLNFKNIVIVTDKNLMNSLIIQQLIDIFVNKYNGRLIILDSGEPDYEVIKKTSIRIFEKDCDAVLGLGGGSILDIVKSASMYENSLEEVDNFSASRKKYSKKLIKTIAVPTTAGTGSEFTHTSVYKTRLNIKNWLWDELTYFDYVLYIPTLTSALPKEITISSGVDAFDHLIESLMSLKFNKKNINLCNIGMETIWNSLPKLLINNNIKERSDMLLASGLAGKAIHYTGCGICHCIAHTLGSLTKVPHGIAVAYGLMNTIEPVLKHNKKLLNRFKGSFENTSLISLVQNIQDWISNLDIDYSLIEKKINFKEFERIYFLEDNKSMRDNTYYQPNSADIKILLKDLWN